ncbi:MULTISPECIES: glycosyltransferase [Tenacibaculum]|uniref:glycosyltransferase n=1 Tax=Tenacibaculum TaxID=104267 RepID=UPI001F0AA59F|nr:MULTISPECIES: glycosyltransferase [Tenacibaculum]MCH3881947.1 glycosyltransferase [Tenacibaculum aquimarinum]MDO6600700.1 glycosyltransferase [Tenacibaculum sp. 1_MG-2023]
MKIAIICNYVLKPNRIGGMDRFYKLFNKKCLEVNHQVDWYFSHYEEFNFYQGLSIISSEGTSVEQKFIDSSKEKNINYDVIITHFTQLCTKYYKQFKELHPNSYTIAVDHNARPLKGYSLKKSIKKRIDGLLYSKYINQFIGVSKYTFHHILKDYGKNLKQKTQVIYNGIDTTVFKKKDKDLAHNFIVVAHLTYNKGIQDLLKALSLIDKNLLKNTQIDIYGEGPFEHQLKTLTNDFQLESIVNFKGSSSELNILFANYSYMIQPTYMECFSLSILESLSANVPVIATTVGGNLEVLKDQVNSYIFKPKDYTKLASILTAILSGKEKITIDVSKLIEDEFYIEKMAVEHLKLIPCI